jgi:hypothetical protein
MKRLLLLAALLLTYPLAPAATGTASLGQMVTFSVTSDGTPPFTYQWKKEGAALPGAVAATYVIPAATLADAGLYTVQVSNQWGTVLSDTATLTVKGNAPTSATTSLAIAKPPGT